MKYEDVANHLPKDWFPMDLHRKYQAFPVPRHTMEFFHLEQAMAFPFNLGIQSIYKIQNPLMYLKYQHRLEQYKKLGKCEIIQMFHDSSSINVESISTYNFDWRFGERFKHGPGVYFSPTADLAFKYSNRLNGEKRAMFFVDVLVGNVQIVEEYDNTFLPDIGYDTVMTKRCGTYVKYFDSDFYPKYVAFYYGAS